MQKPIHELNFRNFKLLLVGQDLLVMLPQRRCETFCGIHGRISGLPGMIGAKGGHAKVLLSD